MFKTIFDTFETLTVESEYPEVSIITDKNDRFKIVYISPDRSERYRLEIEKFKSIGFNGLWRLKH